MVKQLVAVGACYLDTILTWVGWISSTHISLIDDSVDHYPAEDEKLRASSIDHRRGGNCPNTLEVLQQLVELKKLDPVSLILYSVLPSKSSVGTQKIKSSFGPKVDMSLSIYREEFIEPASSYIMKSRSTDSRTIVNYNELPEMTCEEFVSMINALENQGSWFHFEAGLPFSRFYILIATPLNGTRDEYQKSLWSACDIFVEPSPLPKLAWR